MSSHPTSHKKQGGTLGLEKLVMPSGVNPFITTVGLAALSRSGKINRKKVSATRGRTRGASKRLKRSTVGKRNSASKSLKRSTVGKRGSASKSLKRSTVGKKSVSKRKKTSRQTRRGGNNIMSLLFPRGLTPTITAAGLATLSKTGNVGRRALSKLRSVSRKKRPIIKRRGKKQTGGLCSLQHDNVKRGGTCGFKGVCSKKSGGKRGGTCGFKGVGSKKSGGSSQFLARSAYARGSSSWGDSEWGESSRGNFTTFTKTGSFVPNSALARGYIAPQNSGLNAQFCGR